MSTLYNRYGMPNANYNQPADTNPIAAGAKTARLNAPRSPVHGPRMPAAPSSPVERDGKVNLAAVAPITNKPIDTGLNPFVRSQTQYPVKAHPPAAPQAPPEALGLISQLQGTLSPTSQSLDPIIAALQSKGYTAARAPRAGNRLSDDKLVVNGSMYDLINDVGGANAGWSQNFVNPNPPSNHSALASALMAPSYGDSVLQSVLQNLATKSALR